MERIIGHDLGDGYRLSTGRTFYANNGIIGIGPDCGQSGHLSEGYDGTIEITSDWDDTFVAWTADERAELADEMIRRWRVFKGGDAADDRQSDLET